MGSIIDKYKGIHPGKIIERELSKLDKSQRAFAPTIGEHFQTLNAVITGRRKLTIELADKLDRAFGFEPGFFHVIQAHYEARQYNRNRLADSLHGRPDVRKVLFWDFDFDKIDWAGSKSFIIGRILERGNEKEIAEIMRFYNIAPANLDQYKPTNSYRMRAAR